MKKLHFLTRDGRFHYHSFGCYDHFYHVDESISKFNYLRYSNQKWKRIDNSIQPQNRRRIDYFEHVFNRIGLNIEGELNSEPNYQELARLDRIDNEFLGIPKEILTVDYGTYLLSK